MDVQNDSSFFSRLSKRNQPGLQNNESLIIPPKIAQEVQNRQSMRVAEAEIEELKQSLRYVEIQLARSREEKETLNNKISDQQKEIEKGQETLAKQVKYSQGQAKQIEELQRKLESFTNSQKDLVEKSRFKAGNYMSEINQREDELGRIRAQLMNNQDELKLLTVSREQLRQQKEVLAEQIKGRDQENEKLKCKVEELNRVLDSMCMAQRNLNGSDFQGEAMDKARDDIERAERIARTTNKSSFMSLGEKQPRLVSEEHVHQPGGLYFNNTLRSGKAGAIAVEDSYKAQQDDTYLKDDSLPSEIFNVIQLYREKILKYTKASQSAALVFDDFFGEVHRILKDQHMREIARIRNEHSVEIIKLRKNLDKNLRSASSDPHASRKQLRSKENFQAFKGSEKFIENEIERQRRALVEENELLKKRLRALETITQSGNQERTKFMEGASWIAKKAHIETEKHIQKVQNLIGEFQRKARDCIIDESIYELNGKATLQVNAWIQQELEQEISQVGERFESILENVSYHLSEATKQFVKYK